MDKIKTKMDQIKKLDFLHSPMEILMQYKTSLLLCFITIGSIHGESFREK